MTSFGKPDINKTYITCGGCGESKLEVPQGATNAEIDKLAADAKWEKISGRSCPACASKVGSTIQRLFK